jgi:hypothetical protein
MDRLVHWWRVVTTPPRASYPVGHAAEVLPTLILVNTSPDDVSNLKADLPEFVRRGLHELWNSPPAPAFPSIIHGASFTLGDDSIGTFWALFGKSRLLRVAVIGEQDATTAALFAGQLKDPSSVIIVRGWPPGSGAALTAQLETARRVTIPAAFVEWCSVTPHGSALVLCGEETHHLALQVPRARLNYRHMTLKTVANVMHRWFWEMRDASVLFVETSFDEALSPALHGTGLQARFYHYTAEQTGDGSNGRRRGRRRRPLPSLPQTGLLRYPSHTCSARNLRSFSSPADCQHAPTLPAPPPPPQQPQLSPSPALTPLLTALRCAKRQQQRLWSARVDARRQQPPLLPPLILPSVAVPMTTRW